MSDLAGFPRPVASEIPHSVSCRTQVCFPFPAWSQVPATTLQPAAQASAATSRNIYHWQTGSQAEGRPPCGAWVRAQESASQSLQGPPPPRRVLLCPPADDHQPSLGKIHSGSSTAKGDSRTSPRFEELELRSHKTSNSHLPWKLPRDRYRPRSPRGLH